MIQYKKHNPQYGYPVIKAKRINPYNPLSYVTIVLVLIASIVMFGFYGFTKEIDLVNPFKWQRN